MSRWPHIIQRRDTSYPYRLDLYRRNHFGDPKGKSPLIVVHGYSAQIYGMQWLVHMLADALQTEYAVYQFAFETKPGLLADNPLSLELASRELAHEIRRVVDQDKLSTKNVAFVGHSTGGLVARRAFVDSRSLWDQARFVFFGTPHFGAEAADVKNFLTRRDKQTQELAPASDFIWRLNRDWAALPDGALDRALSIVGTNSSRLLQWGLPRGRWVQADSVVRSTSAMLTSSAPGDYFGLFVPFDHSKLKDVPVRWKEQGTFRRKWQKHPPDPDEDLPIIATLAFLSSASPTYKKQCNTHTDLWIRCLDWFEYLERESEYVRKRQMAGWEEGVDGAWRPASRRLYGEYGPWIPDGLLHLRKDELELIIKLHGENPENWPSPAKYPLEYKVTEQPQFLQALVRYAQEVSTWWGRTKVGSALIRLDFIDVPPRPAVVSLVNPWVADGFIYLFSDEGPSLPVPPGSIIRHGERWATLWIPELTEGEYRVEWRHGSHSFSADFNVMPHCTTTVEIDGSRLQIQDRRIVTDRQLSGDLIALSRDINSGFDALYKQLGSRQWDLDWDKGEPMGIRARTDY